MEPPEKNAPDWIIAAVVKNESVSINIRRDYALILLERKSPLIDDPEISQILFSIDSRSSKRASFDVWDTLISRRSVEDKHRDPEGVFPIMENVLKVRPGDLLISDHYAPYDFLKHLIEITTGLKNELYLSESDKLSGKAWKDLGHTISFHYGDNPAADYHIPKSHGVSAHLYTGPVLTEVEAALRTEFPDLALTIRQARLMTYNQKYRDYQHLQTQINFPLLYLASLILHERCLKDGIVNILMSSRDSCLWVKLYNQLSCFGRWPEKAVYFYSSRMSRTNPSQEYLSYVKNLITDHTLVLDLCGYGNTLPKLVDKINPNIPIVLLSKFPHSKPNRTEGLVKYYVAAQIECANFARHPQFLDIVDGKPVFFNPANIPWESQPEIEVGHKTFEFCLSLLEGEIPKVGLAELHIGKLMKTLEMNGGEPIRFLTNLQAQEEPAILSHIEQM
jgi:hypothetical protein